MDDLKEMGATNQRFAELEKLLSKLHDGLAEPEEIARVEHLLDGDPEACEFYLDYTQMVAAVEMEVGVRPPLELGNKTVPLGIAQSTALFFEGQNTRQILTPKWTPLPWFAAAAAVLLFAGSLAIFFGEKNPILPADAVAEEAVTQNGVAVLMQRVGASFAKGGLQPEQTNGVLPLGEVRLESGIAEIEFYSGARVLLEGPAVFELDSQNSGVLHEGRVRAQVPEAASGFSVGTPQVEVVDRGTEFAVSIGEDGHRTEVHCFDGSVDIYDAGERQVNGNPKPRRTLNGTQAVAITPNGIRKMSADPMAFVSYEDMAQTALAAAASRHRAWSEHVEQLRADDHIVALFSFDEQGPTERTLVNQALYQEQVSHGAIVGCRWTSGRWPSKGALAFGRSSDRVRIHADVAYESLTLAAWVRADDLARRPNVLLSSVAHHDPGSLRWSVGRDGKLSLEVRTKNGKRPVRHESKPVLTGSALGGWHHLATVYDAGAGKVIHYFDGNKVTEKPIPDRASAQLLIGNAQIGNAVEKNSKGKPLVRHLEGRIDEFAIFSRAFDAGEIAEMASFGPQG